MSLTMPDDERRLQKLALTLKKVAASHWALQHLDALEYPAEMEQDLTSDLTTLLSETAAWLASRAHRETSDR